MTLLEKEKNNQKKNNTKMYRGEDLDQEVPYMYNSEVSDPISSWNLIRDGLTPPTKR